LLAILGKRRLNKYLDHLKAEEGWAATSNSL
jgi:hypothetical protein